MKPIKRMLLRIARIRWLGAVIGLAFEHAAVFLPIQRITMTNQKKRILPNRQTDYFSKTFKNATILPFVYAVSAFTSRGLLTSFFGA